MKINFFRVQAGRHTYIVCSAGMGARSIGVALRRECDDSEIAIRVFPLSRRAAQRIHGGDAMDFFENGNRSGVIDPWAY